MERWIPAAVTLLCVVLSGVGALTVEIPKPEYEYARGDNITLPCSFTTKASPPSLVIITWSIEGIQANAKENLILTHYHPIKRTDISSMYENRAFPDIDVPKGKANLKLRSIRLADNKMFECRVQIPGDDEGTPADTARLVVLVAPSTPICKVQGKAEYGQNINLTCHSEEGSPPPEYSWEALDVQQRPRQFPGVSNRGDVKPLLNISRETSGFYRCTSKNKIRSASCNVTLAVMPPSSNVGATVGIIVGVIAFLVALIVIIYCCCCRKKKEEKEYAMGVRQDEYHDNEGDVNEENRRPEREENSEVRSAADRRDQYEDKSERDYDRGRDHDDRGADYDDRGRNYDDRRSDHGGREYDDGRSDYNDRASDYENRRDQYSDRRERYDDDRRYEDERRYNDRRDPDDRY